MITRIQKQLKPVLERFGVERAIVFGSVARRDVSRHSDLDLIVIQRTKKRMRWQEEADAGEGEPIEERRG